MPTMDVDLSKAFDMKGKWWLPDTPENQVTGVLKFDPVGDFVLKLDGLLEPTRPFASSPSLHPPVIYGISKEGQRCSLLGTFEKNLSFRSGFSTSVFAMNGAVIGEFTPPLESLKCQSASIC